MKHFCPECGTQFESNLEWLPLILKCNLCLALANAVLLAQERYPDQGEQALRHAKFVRETFIQSNQRPMLELR